MERSQRWIGVRIRHVFGKVSNCGGQHYCAFSGPDGRSPLPARVGTAPSDAVTFPPGYEVTTPRASGNRPRAGSRCHTAAETGLFPPSLSLQSLGASRQLLEVVEVGRDLGAESNHGKGRPRETTDHLAVRVPHDCLGCTY